MCPATAARDPHTKPGCTPRSAKTWRAGPLMATGAAIPPIARLLPKCDENSPA